MKSKRILILIVVFVMFGTVTALASDSFSWYKGKSVKVLVNDEELEVPGLLISGNTALDNITMLPVREFASTLQAIVNWDSRSQTVTIHKPNVHITLLEAHKDGSLTFFGQVAHKLKPKFHIFTQIDNITTKVHSFKVTVVDPKGRIVHEYEEKLKEKMESIWHASEVTEVEFKELGGYTVQVFMKINEKDDYSLVSEKVIQSIQSK